MASYTYLARDMQGKTVSGVLTAESQQQALRALDEQSLFTIDIREGGVATKALGKGKKKIPGTKVAVFYSQFADLLRAGVPALRSLDVMARQTSHPVLKEVLHEVRERLSGGQTLADAMGEHPNAFNPLHVSMIRAGERGGFLEEVLARIAVFTERQNELRNKLIGAMIYPAVLMTAGTAIVLLLLLVVVPKIRSFLRGNLPTITQMVFGLCDFLQANGKYILGGVVALGVAIYLFVRSSAGRAYFDRFQLKAPMLGKIVTLVAICRFCRILGTLLHNGVPVLQALKISKDSAGNKLLTDAIENATESVRNGASLAAPLAKSKLFPLDIIDMIAVGEESNNLESVLVNIADSYETRTARAIDLMVRMLEPMLLIIMAMFVAFIAIALLLPILTMSGRPGS